MTAKKDFQTDMDAMRADIAALTENASELAKEASKAQAAMSKSAKKAAKASARIGAKTWDEVSNLGSDTTQAVRDAVRSGSLSVEKQIKRNPVNAVLCALGVGFVFGFLSFNGRK
jgi:ElaB/YqjD/DUF883 family membrane-anchored ribosome-binding protein